MHADHHITNFIHAIPKAELHLHIEGSLEPELMFEIAQRNQVVLPFNTVAEVRAAYQFTNLQSFLDIYYACANVLIHERDFYAMTWAYLARVAKQNVKHVEIFFDPQTHTERNIDFVCVIKGISTALADARQQFGMTTHLIMCFLRHLDATSAMQTLEQALPYKHLIKAVGLDSGEVGNPPEKFTAVFERALAEGLLTVAHAGEEGPPDYIWQALTLLKASRIDHGVRCLEDPELVDHLVREQIPLTVCPLSNLKLQVVKSLEQHPLRKLLHAGVCATINSDDPAFFGGYAIDNYLQSKQALNLTASEIATLAKNSFRASFISDTEKQRYYSEIDVLLAALPR